jgi:hypothetical protein
MRRFALVILSALLVSCGGGLNSSAMSAELYDPVANAWSPAADMYIPRVWYTATRLPNGDVLVTGGTDVSGGLNLGQPESYW